MATLRAYRATFGQTALANAGVMRTPGPRPPWTAGSLDGSYQTGAAPGAAGTIGDGAARFDAGSGAGMVGATLSGTTTVATFGDRLIEGLVCKRCRSVPTRSRGGASGAGADGGNIKPEPDLAMMSQAEYERRRREGWWPPLQPEQSPASIAAISALRFLGRVEGVQMAASRHIGCEIIPLAPRPLSGATELGFHCLDPTQDLAESAVELTDGHVIGRVGMEQEESDFPLEARTSFTEPPHEQPHQLGMSGRKSQIDLAGLGHSLPRFGSGSPSQLRW